jgi:hypothetical protein
VIGRDDRPLDVLWDDGERLYSIWRHSSDVDRSDLTPSDDGAASLINAIACSGVSPIARGLALAIPVAQNCSGVYEPAGATRR